MKYILLSIVAVAAITLVNPSSAQARCVHGQDEFNPARSCGGQESPPNNSERPSVPTVSSDIVWNSLSCDVAHAIKAGEIKRRRSLDKQEVLISMNWKYVDADTKSGEIGATAIPIGSVKIGGSGSVSQTQNVTILGTETLPYDVTGHRSKCTDADLRRIRSRNYRRWLAPISDHVRRLESGPQEGLVERSFAVTVTTTRSTGLSVNFLVFKIGGENKFEDQTVHTITVKTELKKDAMVKWWWRDCRTPCITPDTGTTQLTNSPSYVNNQATHETKEDAIKSCRVRAFRRATIEANTPTSFTLYCSNELVTAATR